MQSKLDQCESDNQYAIITKNELESCRGELTDEQNSKQQIYQELQSAKRNIKTLEDRIGKLENENQDLSNENQNLQNSLDLCQETGKIKLTLRNSSVVE